MGASLKLVSVNIERSNHLDRVLSFLGRENPDVVCMQELLDRDIPFFERAAGPCVLFTPNTRWPEGDDFIKMGDGIFSRLACARTDTRRYAGTEELCNFEDRNAETKHATQSYNVSYADIEKNTEIFRIATTHFTWTPKGEADDHQRRDVVSLLGTLSEIDEFVLTGDFNAPRGKEIFSQIAAVYKDNIPLSYQSSIDLELHRAGKLPAERMNEKMVDGLFTTPEYRAYDVRLEFGVSDHAGVIATIERTS